MELSQSLAAQHPRLVPLLTARLLFPDLTPHSDRSQVFRIPVNGGGVPDPERVLILPPDAAREVGPYHVELVSQPRCLAAKRESQLIFRGIDRPSSLL